MDERRFDDLSRVLARSTTRRQTLKGLLAGIFGGVAAAVAPGAVAARDGGNSACAEFCHTAFSGSAAGECTSEAAQGRGPCYECGPAAPPNNQQVLCGGRCVSTACTGGQVFDLKACACACPVGMILCNGKCVTTATDPNNCGTCGNVCLSRQTCSGGICRSTSCFTTGTLIAMADGTSRPIERVEVGEHVLGRTGRTNRVVEVERPVLGQRQLYALNGRGFFVTAEHPFMTDAGWKAIEPAALAAENSALQVGRLSVGDRLVTLAAVALLVGAGGAVDAEQVDLRLDSVPLRTLVGQSADPSTPLYNLRLDGDHAYFANELLVHNK